MERSNFPIERYEELLREAKAHGDARYLQHLENDFVVRGNEVFPKIDFTTREL